MSDQERDAVEALLNDLLDLAENASDPEVKEKAAWEILRRSGEFDVPTDPDWYKS